MSNYYIYTIQNRFNDADLKFLLRPYGEWSYPEIYISKTNKYPNSRENSDFFCDDFGVNLCSVSPENITNGETFYVGVLCYFNCSYDLRVDYTQEFSFTLGQYVYLEFDETTSVTIKLFVPQITQDIDHMLITLNMENAYRENETYHFYVNEGNKEPSSQNHDYYSTPIWHEGKGILIEKQPVDPNLIDSKKKYLKLNSNYTILIEAPKNSILILRAEPYSKNRAIQLFEKYHDIIGYGKTLTYQLQLGDNEVNMLKNQTLDIEFRQYSGFIQVYVGSQNYSDLNKYEYNSSISFGHIMISLSKLDRVFKGFQPDQKVYYISVVGLTKASYSFNARTRTQPSSLNFGENVIGYVENSEILNYRLHTSGNSSFNVTLSLISDAGNSELYVKRCNKNVPKPLCMITQNDIDNRNLLIKQPNNNFYFSNNQGTFDSIKFFLNSTDCLDQDDQYKKCTYAVGVYGNNTNGNISHFDLTAKHSLKHFVLQQNHPYRAQIQQGESELFKFTLEDDSNVDSIVFQTTCITGEIIVFSSKKYQYPDIQNSDYYSYFDFDPVYYDSEDKNETGTLTGTYYLRVHGYSAAYYTFQVIIIQKTQIKDSSLVQEIELKEGFPQKVSYQNQSNKFYFRFTTKLQNDSNSVAIKLNGLQGKFKMYVTDNNDVVSEKNYIWSQSEDDGALVIDKQDPKFKLIDTYHILVSSQDQVSDAQNKRFSNQFLISYSTSKTIQTLIIDQAFKGDLKKGETQYYQFMVHHGDQEFEISKTIYNQNASHLILYLSLQEKVQFPDKHFHEYQLNSTGNDSLFITQKDIADYCPSIKNENNNYKPCFFHLSVQNYLDSQIDFSLLVRRKRASVNLIDGVSVQSQLPSLSGIEDTVNFYYLIPKNNQSLSVFESSPQVDLVVYARVIIFKNHPKKSEWQYPTENNSCFSSQNNSLFGTSSLTIKPKDMHSECESDALGCVLLLSVKRNIKKESNLIQNDKIDKKTFSIQVTSAIARLHEGRPLIDSIKSGEYKYYYFKVQNKSSNLIISVSPIHEGDPDLVISFGADERPSISKNDFKSNKFRADQIEINQNSSVKFQSKTGMIGTFVVGVFGYKNCTFELSYTSSSHKIINLYDGMAHERSLIQGDSYLFKYQNYFNQTLKFILSISIGKAKFYINTFSESSQNLIDVLPNQTYYTWSSEQQNRDLILIQKTDKNFCMYCDYIIRVVAEKDTSFTMIAASEKSFIHLQGNKYLHDYVFKNTTNSYYFGSSVPRLRVNLIVLAGKVEMRVFSSYFDYQDNKQYASYIGNSESLNQKHINIQYGNEKYIIPNETQASKQNEIFSFYISVVGQEDTAYQIEVSAGEEIKILRYGVIDYQTLEPLQVQQYLFYTSQQNQLIEKDNEVINLLISYIQNDNKQVYLTKPTVTIKYISDQAQNGKPNEQIQNKSARIFRNISSPQGNLLEIEQLEGQYIIELKNPSSNYSLKYSLILNSDDINLMLPNSYIAMSMDVGEQNNYEFFVSKPQKMLFEVYECFGKVKAGAASTQLDLYNRNYSKIIAPRSKQIVSVVDMKPGPIYFNIEAIQGYDGQKKNSEKQNETLFILKTHVLPQTSVIPYDHFFPGNDGVITYNFTMSQDENVGQQLSINFVTIQCTENCSNEKSFKPYYYEYLLHISDQQDLLESYSKCDVGQFIFEYLEFEDKLKDVFYIKFNKFFSSNEEHPNLATFNIPLSQIKMDQNSPKTLYANIVAMVYIEENKSSEQFTFIYNPVQIQLSSILIQESDMDPRVKYGIAFGVLFLVIILIGIIFYICKRNKKMEKKLKYEMTDIKNMANEYIEEQIERKEEQNIKMEYRNFLNDSTQKSDQKI